MKSKCSLLEMVGHIIDSGEKVINCALAQEVGQASIAQDDSVMDLDDHLCSQLDHWARCIWQGAISLAEKISVSIKVLGERRTVDAGIRCSSFVALLTHGSARMRAIVPEGGHVWMVDGAVIYLK